MWDGVIGCEVPGEAHKAKIRHEREGTEKQKQQTRIRRRVAQEGGGTVL